MLHVLCFMNLGRWRTTAQAGPRLKAVGGQIKNKNVQGLYFIFRK